MATRTLMTIEQYDALPEKEGAKYELNEGELVTVSPSPRLIHNCVRDEIGFRLREYVRSGQLGEVTMETDFKLTEGTIRIPDVCKCEILANLAARVLEPFKKGEIVRRARRTIGRGSGERLA